MTTKNIQHGKFNVVITANAPSQAAISNFNREIAKLIRKFITEQKQAEAAASPTNK